MRGPAADHALRLAEDDQDVPELPRLLLVAGRHLGQGEPRVRLRVPAHRLAERDIRRGSRNPHSRPTESLAENLDEMGQKKTREHLEMDLSRIADGLIIEFGEKASFAPASATVSIELAKSLQEIGRVLEHYPHMVVVEGFTDGNFTSSPSYASPEELSFARAESAARVLATESNLSNAVLQLAGHGAEHPRADNVSASGRRLNRRVQLRVLSMSKVRAGYLESRRNSGEEEG